MECGEGVEGSRGAVEEGWMAWMAWMAVDGADASGGSGGSVEGGCYGGGDGCGNGRLTEFESREGDSMGIDR